MKQNLMVTQTLFPLEDGGIMETTFWFETSFKEALDQMDPFQSLPGETDFSGCMRVQ